MLDEARERRKEKDECRETLFDVDVFYVFARLRFHERVKVAHDVCRAPVEEIVDGDRQDRARDHLDAAKGDKVRRRCGARSVSKIKYNFKYAHQMRRAASFAKGLLCCRASQCGRSGGESSLRSRRCAFLSRGALP